MVARVLCLLLLMVFLSSCGAPQQVAEAPTALPVPTSTPAPTCVDQAGPFLEQFKSLAQRWDDANKLAQQVPRVSLAPQIAELQKIRRETGDLVVSECTQGAQTSLVLSMDATIDGYLAFLGQQPQSAVEIYFASARNAMLDYQDELLKASGVTPPERTPLPLVPPTPTMAPVPTARPMTTYEPTLTVAQPSAALGSSIEVQGKGWPPRQYVEILIGPQDQKRRQIVSGGTSNEAGTFTATIQLDNLPSGDPFTPGEYEVVGQIKGPTYSKLRPKQTIIVTAP